MRVVRAVRIPTAAEIVPAAQVVSRYFPPTPVLGSLKLETLQPTGSFKVRGAVVAVAAAPAEAHIVTASAGNHGLGVAYAARLLGRRVTVVVPVNASRAKVPALRELGVDLVEAGTSYDEAEQHALTIPDSHFVSPYNDPDVIAGQGSIGVELNTQVPGPVTVVCPAGGGGLVSGLGLWASLRTDVRVVAVEVAASTGLSSSVRENGDVVVPIGESLADGLLGNLEPGSVTVGLAGAHVHQFTTVAEDELRMAIRHLASTHGVVAEGSGAAAVAALLAGKVEVVGTPVALVTGRNIALSTLADVLA